MTSRLSVTVAEAPEERSGRRVPPVARNTHVVPGLRRLVEGQVHAAFPHRIWVAGEVGRIVIDPDETVRFELCADDEGQALRLACAVPGAVVPELREVLGRIHDADVEDVLVPGRLARVGGLLRYDFVADSLGLIVSELDPSTTAQGLAEDREHSLEQVRGARLAEQQRVLRPAVAPTRVAIVGAPDDPELRRAVTLLAGSGYGVRPDVVPVPRHTVGHAGHLARAVTVAAQQNDLVLLLRSQGRPLGLAVFDSTEMSAAIADAPVPVLTGLGGAGEQTACDEVAFASHPTAEAAAESVLVRLRAAEQSLRTISQQIAQAARQAAGRAESDLRRAAAAVVDAAAQADIRSKAAHRRRWIALLVLCSLLAVATIAVTVITKTPLVLLGLLAVAVVLLVARRWSTRSRTRGSRPVDLQDVDFAHVLERLDRVRDELIQTSSPERVYRLRDTAAQLVVRGEQLLGRRLDGSRPASAAATVGREGGSTGPRLEKSRAAEPRSTEPRSTDVLAPESAATEVSARAAAVSGGSRQHPIEQSDSAGQPEPGSPSDQVSSVGPAPDSTTHPTAGAPTVVLPVGDSASTTVPAGDSTPPAIHSEEHPTVVLPTGSRKVERGDTSAEHPGG